MTSKIKFYAEDISDEVADKIYHLIQGEIYDLAMNDLYENFDDEGVNQRLDLEQERIPNKNGVIE